MNVMKIVKTEGYRYEDLSADDKVIVDFMLDMVESVEGMRGNYEDADGDPPLALVYNSVAREVLDEAIDTLRSHVVGVQIALAEGEEG